MRTTTHIGTFDGANLRATNLRAAELAAPGLMHAIASGLAMVAFVATGLAWLGAVS